VEILFAIYVAVSLAVFTAVAHVFLRSFRNLQTQYDRVEVTPESPVLPEAHILAFRPVPLKIGGRTLYIQPLTTDGHNAYTNKMMQFLVRHRVNLAGIRMLTMADLLTEDNRKELAANMGSARNNAAMIKDAQAMLAATFLKSKKVNPERITLRQIRKEWTWIDTFQVWQMAYAVQVQSTENFIQYLLGQLTGTEQQNAGSPLLKQQGPPSQKSASGPLMPKYSQPNESPKKTSA